MAKSKKQTPTELELLILKVLWHAEPGDLPMAVRDVRERLSGAGRKLAHTSVITALNIMVDKRFLKRKKRKNAYLYSPLLKRRAVETNMLGDVLNRVFDGSANNLVLTLLDHSDVNADDLEEIRRLMNRKSRANRRSQ